MTRTGRLGLERQVCTATTLEPIAKFLTNGRLSASLENWDASPVAQPQESVVEFTQLDR